jgi:DNA helicase II / ATP-dependent DNA helicase PcrA
MTNAGPGVPLLERISLNPVQKAAVLYDEGPQLVFAGAGTGKTRVLTAKIAWLIRHKGVSPGGIFAATFTNKAAREMQRRVEDLAGIPCAGLWIGTFHSMCARILRREAVHVGFPPWFSIFDADDQLSCVKKVTKELSLDERTMPPRLVLSSISRYKNACVPPASLAGTGKNFFESEIIRAYAAYQESLVKQQAMDFDDLLSNCVYLLRGNPEVLRKYRSAFSHVLVDEYQDTNTAQFHLVKLLAAEHKNVFVVGDDDQSIYAWRGAQVENILTFEKSFPGTKTFTLEENYRSTGAVLSFANAAIEPNTVRAKKRLFTGKRGGEPVAVVRYRDDRHESDSVCESVSKFMQSGVKPSDIAVLFRTNAQSRLFEDSLRKRRIPYVLVGGTSFYERREIKDCLAYLRLCVNPRDDVSCERIINVPPRGMGDKAREHLAARGMALGKSLLQTVCDDPDTAGYGRGQKGLLELREIFILLSDLVAQKEPPDRILKEVLSLTGYLTIFEGEDSEEAEGRLDNVSELVNALSFWTEENPGKGLPEFLEEISLATDVDRWNRKDDSVNLMTLHCAKGLEFRRVFIVGCEDGILPSRQNFDDNAKMEEERRLLYVGITRAMEGLAVSYADLRWRFGSCVPQAPSRFLTAIPRELYAYRDNSFYEREEPKPAATRPPKRVVESQEPAYRYEDFSQESVQLRMGQQVTHKLYGKGKIVNLSGFGDDMRIVVLFNDGARRKMMAKFADLETA